MNMSSKLMKDTKDKNMAMDGSERILLASTNF
jgi:hypothetical protein